LILSDVHLGSRNSRAALVSRLLDEQSFDRLILNGDTINNVNLKKLKRKHWLVLHQLREVARQRELILIRGNHEGLPGDGLPFGPLDVLGTLLGVPQHEEYQLEMPDGHYLVLHGDRFDPTLTWPILTDTADWCYQAVQKVNKKAAKWLKKRVKRMGGVIEFVKRRAVRHARELGCQGVITGHTHFCDNEWIDGIHYINSGCWVETTCTYVLADHRQIRLCHWNGEGLPEILEAPCRLTPRRNGTAAAPEARDLVVN
jgi:UDP-2,3-diacylglucosamine pyrophosphatase LpxH